MNLLELLFGPTGPLKDPVPPHIMETMQKEYGHHPEYDDPVVTLGMAPERVRHMSDPYDLEHNWGGYYRDEDSVFLNPTISRDDYRDTGRHEFRHRGAAILDGDKPQDFHLEELAALMTDTTDNVGDDASNAEFLRYSGKTVADEKDIPVLAALLMGDIKAGKMNRKARRQLGGGTRYRSRLLELLPSIMGR